MKKKKILIVDDSQVVRTSIEKILKTQGFENLCFADSARKALEMLGVSASREERNEQADYDLILLDIVLPDIDGRAACRLIKSAEHLADVPVIMVTSLTKKDDLKKAFDAGAVDYITKPIHEVELLARIQSSLKLKMEIDQRKGRELELLKVTKQLEEAVQALDRLSTMDGLTGIPNRRFFDQALQKEWNRARRHARELSLVFIDIDCFKAYNDTYGHLAGDDCLKAAAGLLQQNLRRGGDMIFRYGGEEFVVLLPETFAEGALQIAEKMRKAVETARITHATSPVAGHLTISLGVVTAVPGKDALPDSFIAAADKALYAAKEGGRNRVAAGTIDVKGPRSCSS